MRVFPPRLPPPASLNRLPSWSKQGQRQNHFLRRHAAVEKGAAVPALVLAKLRRIDEEAVVGRKQGVAAGTAPRQPQHVLAREQQRLIGSLGAQVLAELVAEIGAGVALGVHGCRRVAVDRAVVGGEQHRDLSARSFLQHAEQRRALEPLSRYLPQSDLVARDLVKDLRFAPPVSQQVDEVEHEGADALGTDCGAEMSLELVGVCGRRDLLVADGGLATELLEMRFEQLTLVGVE